MAVPARLFTRNRWPSVLLPADSKDLLGSIEPLGWESQPLTGQAFVAAVVAERSRARGDGVWRVLNHKAPLDDERVSKVRARKARLQNVYKTGTEFEEIQWTTVDVEFGRNRRFRFPYPAPLKSFNRAPPRQP